MKTLRIFQNTEPGTDMFKVRSLVFLLLVIVAAGCKDMGTDPQYTQTTTPPTTPPPTGTISFSQHVLPILQSRGCTGCHGGSGGLVVTSVASLLTGGNHGAAIVAGQADNSNIIKKLSATPPFGLRMPQGGPYLADSTIAVIRAWINQGALNN
jgi:hypothetical protein